MESFLDKRVTVLGLARSGEAAAGLLSRLGAHVLVSDLKGEEQLKDAISRLARTYPQIRFYLGGHPNEVIDSADLVVISPGVPGDIPILKYAREKDIPVIGEVELAYRVCQAPIIAITGTKGKSTTSTLLSKILSRRGSGTLEKFHFKACGNTVVAGNIGKPISQYVMDLTESDLLVLEVSSFQLETIVHFSPKVSVMLNIAPDHLDRYNSVEDYAAAKYRIFMNQADGDYTVLNADDPLTAACASRTRAKVILFSSRKKLDEGVYLEDDEVLANHNESRTAIIKRGELRIPGRHNLENAMAAVAVSLIYGVDPAAMREELRSFSGLEHALEFVDQVRGVKFINDSKCTNVVSLKAALESFPAKGKNLILIIGGRDKGNDYNPVKPLIQGRVSHLILIGESADKIESAIGAYTITHRASALEDAVYMAYSLAKPGDIVLLSPACASFDMFRDYAERGTIFKGLVKRIARSEHSGDKKSR